MNRTNYTELKECTFEKSELEKIENAVVSIISLLKEKNLTFAQATETLLRCKILIGNVKLG